MYQLGNCFTDHTAVCEWDSSFVKPREPEPTLLICQAFSKEHRQRLDLRQVLEKENAELKRLQHRESE
ncbi:MAG: hypothetical protein KVP17_001679 [Porospora cf. gigantea B]|uniref:uncharacterized protein n=1 Tax=Porospora cf. gigantea B TaxID=2853592 RepID=UPI003571A3EE|nr:MAG: hypothetical protein KVP17_001679 [Porospora cf. gigantea B]